MKNRVVVIKFFKMCNWDKRLNILIKRYCFYLKINV